jgi:hypothetical protein
MATHDLHDGAALVTLHRVAQLIDTLDGGICCGIKTDAVIGAADVIIDGGRNADQIDTIFA